MRGPVCSLVLVATLGACAAPGGPYPSLQPRAAEAVDPRVPVDRPLNDRPTTRALAARLSELLAQARDGDSAFQAAAAYAEQLAASAGSAQSESWIAAQEALSAAIAAAGPTKIALSNMDALTAATLQAQGGLAPNDLDAVKRASAEVGDMDQRQADRIAAVQQRLGL